MNEMRKRRVSVVKVVKCLRGAPSKESRDLLVKILGSRQFSDNSQSALIASG